MKILAFGDSITYGKWDIDGGWVMRLRRKIDEEYNILKGSDCKNLQIFNLGIPGETTRRLKERLDSEVKFRIDKDEEVIFIFQVGVNDSNHVNAFHGEQIPIEEVKNNIKEIALIAKKYSSKIIFLGLMPIDEQKLYISFPKFKDKFTELEVEKYNKEISEYMKFNDLNYIDLWNLLDPKEFDDGIHPTALGHEVIANEIYRYLKENKL